MKFKKLIKYIVWFVIIVLIANLPILNKVILSAVDKDHFKYANNDGSFTYTESFAFKDGYISSGLINIFKESQNATDSHKIVYRLYRINPLCFWRWSYYISISSNFKYRDWKNIASSRVKFDEESPWQDF